MSQRESFESYKPVRAWLILAELSHPLEECRICQSDGKRFPVRLRDGAVEDGGISEVGLLLC